jgi:hypothetical protein
MCYKDRTFCSYYKECNDGKECSRALTKKVQNNAKKLGLPISQFACKPDCWMEKQNKGENK